MQRTKIVSHYHISELVLFNLAMKGPALCCSLRDAFGILDIDPKSERVYFQNNFITK